MSQFPTEAYENVVQAVQPVAQARFFQKLASDWNIIAATTEEAESLLKAAGILSQAEAEEMQKAASAASPIVELVSGLEKAAAQQAGQTMTPTQQNELAKTASQLLSSNPQIAEQIGKLVEFELSQANAQVG